MVIEMQQSTPIYEMVIVVGFAGIPIYDMVIGGTSQPMPWLLKHPVVIAMVIEASCGYWKRCRVFWAPFNPLTHVNGFTEQKNRIKYAGCMLASCLMMRGASFSAYLVRFFCALIIFNVRWWIERRGWEYPRVFWTFFNPLCRFAQDIIHKMHNLKLFGILGFHFKMNPGISGIHFKVKT